MKRLSGPTKLEIKKIFAERSSSGQKAEDITNTSRFKMKPGAAIIVAANIHQVLKNVEGVKKKMQFEDKLLDTLQNCSFGKVITVIQNNLMPA